MASLYTAGWRQGSLFAFRLPLDGIITVENETITDIPITGARLALGLPKRLLWLAILRIAKASGLEVRLHQPTPGTLIVRNQRLHPYWLVATQDCDLHRLSLEVTHPLVEIRPVFDPSNRPDHDTELPTKQGIRSRPLILHESYYLHADSKRSMISPSALTMIAPAPENIQNLLTEDRRLALKTWLGLRYDRPAVPDECGDLASAIKYELERGPDRPHANKVRDVLVTFDASDPKRCTLYAVIADAADHQEVIEWLARIALSKRLSKHGIVEGFFALPPDETSLDLIEHAYAIDVSDVTWGTGSPVGAH